MANDEVVLLDSYFSFYCMRVRIALAEKGVEYERREMDLVNKSPVLLEMNPVHKKIPILIHNGRPICDSLIIVQYIDEVWKNKSPLLPSDPYRRAQARFWADFVDKKVYEAERKIPSATEAEEQEAAKKDFIDSLKLLEAELGDKPYFGGDVFGLVDVTLAPLCCSFDALETCENLRVEPHCPRLIEWAKRCMEKESVSKSLVDPGEVCELFLSLKKNVE
ncbi:Glutathione S-transferase U1 [Orobanche gracilis]